jgi:hypothetical protein
LSKKKDKPDQHVLKRDCDRRMDQGSEQFKEIREFLVGKEFGKIGGMMKELAEIKEQLKNLKQNKWTPRDKAIVIAAVVTGASSVITALLAYIHH